MFAMMTAAQVMFTLVGNHAVSGPTRVVYCIFSTLGELLEASLCSGGRGETS